MEISICNRSITQGLIKPYIRVDNIQNEQELNALYSAYFYLKTFSEQFDKSYQEEIAKNATETKT